MRRKAANPVPYEGAQSGGKARDEIVKLLRVFGCESIGFLDDFEKHELTLVFRHRGRHVRLIASAKGWAALWLKEHPYNFQRSRKTRPEYRERRRAPG